MDEVSEATMLPTQPLFLTHRFARGRRFLVAELSGREQPRLRPRASETANSSVGAGGSRESERRKRRGRA